MGQNTPSPNNHYTENNDAARVWDVNGRYLLVEEKPYDNVINLDVDGWKQGMLFFPRLLPRFAGAGNGERGVFIPKHRPTEPDC